MIVAKSIAAAIVTSVIVAGTGKLIGADLDFIAGWFSCLAYYWVQK